MNSDENEGLDKGAGEELAISESMVLDTDEGLDNNGLGDELAVSESMVVDADEGLDKGVGEELAISESMVSESPLNDSPVRHVTMAGEVTKADSSAENLTLTDDDSPVLERRSIQGRNNNTKPIKLLTRIERLMDKMDQRRANRKEVSFAARDKFIDICLEKLNEDDQSCDHTYGMTVRELRLLRDQHKDSGEVGEIFEHAVKMAEEVKARVFYFRDFNEYYLTLKGNYFRRNPTIGALAGVLAYYIFSLILFCGIMQNNSTCPTTDGGPLGEGWLTAIYFASVTISTVGYGDVSVVGSGTEVWRVFIGILYMVFAMVVAVTVFSSLSGKVMEVSGGIIAPKLKRFFGNFTTIKANVSLDDELRRVWLFKIVELSVYFFIINMFGMIVAMIIVKTTDPDNEDWNWMTGLYWAVQTTTTIGYGDLDMPFALRWYNWLFAIIGTTFAASLLGSLAALHSTLQNMRTLYVWEKREVSMQLIADMEIDGDNQLDEYEFLIGSLITLNKLDREDVEKIMDKFRALAGEDQIINEHDIEAHRQRFSKFQITQRDILEYNTLLRQEEDWEKVEKTA